VPKGPRTGSLVEMIPVFDMFGALVYGSPQALASEKFSQRVEVSEATAALGATTTAARRMAAHKR
jgi:hypothetical protein